MLGMALDEIDRDSCLFHILSEEKDSRKRMNMLNDVIEEIKTRKGNRKGCLEEDPQ